MPRKCRPEVTLVYSKYQELEDNSWYAGEERNGQCFIGKLAERGYFGLIIVPWS
jgi:hypothetical protein